MKAILTILLCSSLAVNAPCQEKPQSAAGVGVAIVVICVGSYCIYRVVKFCQKAFPKDKPANTNELYSAFGGAGDEYGGSWNHGSLGSCLPDATGKSALLSGTASPTTFALNIFVASSASIVATMSANTGDGSWQAWAPFQADVASHGLHVSGQNDGSQYFSRNRQPASANDVPIRFGPEPGAVTVDNGGELVRFVVERSTDLEHWEQLLATQYPVGQRLEILDTSVDSQAFYRTRIVPKE